MSSKNNIIDSNLKFKVDGEIVETLPSTRFRVKIELKENEYIVLAHISGKMRMNYIKLQVGDKVQLEMSPYDLTKARIIYRY
ncbi:MAG TPA: translation initiation factor IF-1 [Candidatus Dojkabacteria bacterium]|jgi:translation initiation factor IF-1